MSSRKFPTMEEAISYLKTRGKLEYWGREGADAKAYVYTLTIGGMVYRLLVRENGLVEVMK